MEGEADRREEEDSSEAQSDNLDDLREEIRKRYPYSGEDDREAQLESETSSRGDRGVSDVKLKDATSATESSPEQVHRSVDAERRIVPNERSESNVESEETESELEQLRNYLREKYPSMEEGTDETEKLDRDSQSGKGDADGSNSHLDKTNIHGERLVPAEGAVYSNSEGGSQHGRRDGIMAADGQPAFDKDTGSKVVSSQSEKSGSEFGYRSENEMPRLESTSRPSEANEINEKSEVKTDELEGTATRAGRQPNDPSPVGLNFENASSFQQGRCVRGEDHHAPDWSRSVNQQENLARRFNDETKETGTRPLESDSQVRARQEERFRASDSESGGRIPETGSRRENVQKERFIVSVARRNTTRDGAYHFNLLNSKVEKTFGVTLEEGKRYEIKVRIESVGEFQVHHLQRKNIAFAIEVPRRFVDRVREGEAYKLTIDSVVEQHKLRAVSARDGVSLRIPRADVEAFVSTRRTKREQGRTVTEFQLQNLSKPEESAKRYFSSQEAKSSYQFLVGNRGARESDVFRLVEARKYGIMDFVRDFNVHGSPETQNLKLNVQRGRLSMEVDGQTIRFQQWHLTAFGSKVMLSAKPKGWEREIRFRFDGENIEAKFDRYSRLNWIKGRRYGIEISYFHDSRREIRYRQSLGEFDRRIIVDNVALVSRPKHDGEPFSFTVAPTAQEYVRFKLGATEKYRGYMFEKGRISEELQRHLVSSTGQWDQVATHPTRYGPDSLQRSKASKELYYFEFKWEQSKSIAGTRADALAQAIKDYHKRPMHENERVAGAYIGMLDWDGGGIGKFYLEKAWPPSLEGSGVNNLLMSWSLQPAK